VRNAQFNGKQIVWNARFNGDDGCAMHGPTGMMDAQCKVSQEWWVWNARFHRNGVFEMHGVHWGTHNIN